jgi:hypothetical protein
MMLLIMDTNQLITTLFIILVVGLGIARLFSSTKPKSAETKKAQFLYERKEFLMTTSENEFFKILTEVAGDRYYVFPQIHLASLFSNKTVGRYYKLGFQRINRWSVEYVLCDKLTLKPVYAVELDDASHSKPDRSLRDTAVEQVFKNVSMPLIRFNDYRNLTKGQVAERFYEASQNSN